jgi:uncharacterized lipoprotein YbaY
MRVDVLADPASGERPPPGTTVHVQLRDTSLADAPAQVLASADAVVGDEQGPVLATVDLPDAEAQRLTVWAHADLSGNHQVSLGDYITMQSHPVPSPEQRPGRLGVTVRRVR